MVGSAPEMILTAVPTASIFRLGTTAPKPSIEAPTATCEKSPTTSVGVHTGGVIVPVGVGVGGVTVPVGVKVAVVSVPLGVGVRGVIVPVGVGVDVCVPARLRKTTMVCEAAFPCTMVTLTVRAFRFLLIKRSEGIVYMSVTE